MKVFGTRNGENGFFMRLAYIICHPQNLLLVLLHNTQQINKESKLASQLKISLRCPQKQTDIFL